MCIYMCVHVYTCVVVCVLTCMNFCACLCLSVSVCMCLSVYLCACFCILHSFSCVSVCVYAREISHVCGVHGRDKSPTIPCHQKLRTRALTQRDPQVHVLLHNMTYAAGHLETPNGLRTWVVCSAQLWDLDQQQCLL